MRIKEIEERKAEIAAELDKEGADLEALETELRSLNAEKAELEAEAEKRAALLAEVEKNNRTLEDFKDTEERKETTPMVEIRNTQEYINAYAEYLKNGDATECRALLSINAVGGTVQVPDLVDNMIKTAWDREEVMARVKKTFVKGNYKVGFEISGSDAVIHVEGSGAIAEEELSLGVVELKAASIKKWVSVSDEALDLTGSQFLEWLFAELAYKIAKKAADTLIAKIAALPATSTATAPGAAEIDAAPVLGTVANAAAMLSDEANDIVLIMNKRTEAAFKAAMYAGNFAADPFEGYTVLHNNSLPAYADAGAGDVYMLVGDLGNGAQANFPNGQEITLKLDDLTLATSDLVKVIGREFVAIEAIAPYAFTKIKKPQ